jgi:hypothetical protein
MNELDKKDEASYFMDEGRQGLINQNQIIPWIDMRLTEEELEFLKSILSSITKEQVRQMRDTYAIDGYSKGAGNVARCDLVDKDNWFYENVLKDLTEKLFYDKWENYRKYVVPQNKNKPLPEFHLQSLWANFQKKHDHVPLHNHGGLYSFVVYIKIPTDWRTQHDRPEGTVSNGSAASDFSMVWPGNRDQPCRVHNVLLSPKDEGRMLFWPAWLQHMVYPFYDCEEERISISGNINLKEVKSEEGKVRGSINLKGDGRIHLVATTEQSSEDPKEIKKLFQKFKSNR